jgi:hypothetical protein
MSTQSDAPRETGIAPFVRAIVFVALVGPRLLLRSMARVFRVGRI